jgi:toxoflavin biosynthesis protein ToxD
MGPNPKLNAEGWEVTPSVFNKVQSPFMPYPYSPDASVDNVKAKGRFVVRGGAWYYTRKLARCAAREGIQPNHLSPSIGFRLTQSLP